MAKIKKKAISLIEVLIAIIVVGVGIIVVLNVVIANIGLVDRLKNKTEATFLAKQGLELFLSFRDTNIKRGINWDCLELDTDFNCVKRFGQESWLQIALNWSGGDNLYLSEPDSIYYIKPASGGGYEDNILYFHTGEIAGKQIGYYNYDPVDGQKTKFSRVLHITGVYLAGDGNIVDKDKLIKVESVVKWKHGRRTGQVILETFIGDIK